MKLQVILLIVGGLLVLGCVVVFYGDMQHWYHLPYEIQMSLPIGCYIASFLLLISAGVGIMQVSE
jgi:hypothetical protein